MRTVTKANPGRLAHLSVFLLAMVVSASLVTANAQQAKKMYRIGVLSELAPTATAAGGPRPLLGRTHGAALFGSEAMWRAKTHSSSSAMPESASKPFRHSRMNWSVPKLTSSSLPALHPRLRRSAPRRASRSSRFRLIPSARIWSPASLGQGPMSPDYFVPWSDLSAKGLQLLRDAVPNLDKVAILWNPLNQTAHVGSRYVEGAAKTMGVGTQRIEMRGQEDLDQVSKAIIATRVRGLIVVLDLVTIRAAPSIAQMAAKHRLPGFHAYREFADAGGLMSYGFTEPGLAEAVVEYADKVLRGARPADLPVEQPMRNEFVINLKTAKTLGLKISPSLLGRASHVIE